MITIRFLEKIEKPLFLKKARGNEKLHKLEPSEIFQRLTFTRLDDLKALKDKHWVVIVNRLTKFLKTGKYRPSKSNLEAVICKIFNALDGRFLNVPQIKNFIKVVKLSAFFNPNEPISPKLQALAEKLFKPGNLMVLRLAELGRMYNLIGLIHAAINFNDDLFILLQHRAIDFSLPTFIPYHLAKSVLLNLRYDSILKLFNLPTSLPPESYHLVLLNKRLNPEQKAILVNKILEKGVPTDFLYDNIEPIHLAFEFNLPAVTHLLASRPFKKENARKYFNLALQLNHADTADVLVGQTLLVFENDLTSFQAQNLRNSQETLMKLKGRMKWRVPPDSQYLSRIPSSTVPSEQSNKLARIGAVVHEESLTITKTTVDLMYEMVKSNPQSLSLTHYQSLNSDLFYYLFFKRICHVWSLNINIEHPTFNGLITGEGAPDGAMMLFYIQFLEIIQSDIPGEEIAFALEHLKSFYSISKPLPDLLTIQKLAETSPQVLISGFDKHLSIVILFKSFVIYCDRGGINEREGFRVYQIPKDHLLNTNDIEAILSAKLNTKDTCFSEKKLVAKLNLALLAECSLKRQKLGNCSHASVDAAVAALMSLYLKIKYPLIDWSAAYTIIFPIYKSLTQGYRYYMVQELVDAYNNYKKAGIKVKKVDDYFYKLIINLFLRLKENPHKLVYYTPQGPQLINHLAQILNEF